MALSKLGTNYDVTDEMNEIIGEVNKSSYTDGNTSGVHWVKYDNGELIQETKVKLSLNSLAFQYFLLPIDFVGDYSVIVTPTQNPTSGNQTMWWNNMDRVVGVQRQGKTNEIALLYRGDISDTEGFFHIRAKGRWKSGGVTDRLKRLINYFVKKVGVMHG